MKAHVPKNTKKEPPNNDSVLLDQLFFLELTTTGGHTLFQFLDAYAQVSDSIYKKTYKSGTKFLFLLFSLAFPSYLENRINP